MFSLLLDLLEFLFMQVSHIYRCSSKLDKEWTKKSAFGIRVDAAFSHWETVSKWDTLVNEFQSNEQLCGPQMGGDIHSRKQHLLANYT